jgi:hypothetical protein
MMVFKSSYVKELPMPSCYSGGRDNNENKKKIIGKRGGNFVNQNTKAVYAYA